MTRKRISFFGLLTVLFLLICFSLTWRRAANPPASAPPIRQVKVFALSNAPSVAAQSTWSAQIPLTISNFVAKIAASTNHGPITFGTARGAYVQFKNSQQQDAFKRLENSASGSAQLFLRPDNSTPVQIKGYPLMKAVGGDGSTAAQNEKTARAFLRENASLLLLSDPDKELRELTRETDTLGMANIRYVQTYAGLDVWPAQLSIHLDAHGNVTMMDGAYIATPEGVATKPQISESESETRAKALVPGGTLANGGKSTLIVYGPLDKPPRLGWKSEVVSGIQNDWVVVIDALDGSTLTAFNQCADANVPGSGVDLLGQTRALNVWLSGSKYYMRDASKSMFNPATATGFITIGDAGNLTENQIIVGNTIKNVHDIASTTPTDWNNPDGVSAAYNFSQTYDYYHSRFNRDSYSGKGSDMMAVVRISSYANASWNPNFRMMFFGNVDRYAACLDVIGHELTHGVTYSIGGNGVLNYQDQSGALNEGFSSMSRI